MVSTYSLLHTDSIHSNYIVTVTMAQFKRIASACDLQKGPCPALPSSFAGGGFELPQGSPWPGPTLPP